MKHSATAALKLRSGIDTCRWHFSVGIYTYSTDCSYAESVRKVSKFARKHSYTVRDIVVL